MTLLIITALPLCLASGPRHAPLDVPKNHWAYKAVDELFEAGLLDGYPTPGRPGLTEANVDSVIRRLVKEGMVPGYPGEVLRAGVQSLYDSAAGAFVATHYILGGFAGVEPKPALFAREAPTIAALLHATTRQLIQMKGDPSALLRMIESKYRLPVTQFVTPPITGRASSTNTQTSGQGPR